MHTWLHLRTKHLSVFNMSGQKRYPKWSNHLNREFLFDVYLHKNGYLLYPLANSIWFKTEEQRRAVVLSDIGLLIMGLLVRAAGRRYGWAAVINYYGMPWLLVTHWITMFTFIQHTDPELPHYRGKAWNFQRGAACTVDRDFLGWQGRFFLHNVAHDHVVHHFFPKIPFCK